MSRPPRESVVELRDGSRVVIARITPADAPLLADGFRRLSAESRRLRFLTGKSELSDADLAYLTNVDGERHEALGARDPASGAGVGVARYVRLATPSEVAEVAVAVVDEWQQRGVATALLAELTDRARHAGVRRYRALVSTENTVVIELLKRSGAEIRDAGEPGTVEYEIELAPDGLGASLPSALRAAARGQLWLARPPFLERLRLLHPKD
jgi:RimJ/RimL family protein N-acetyltransferase